jgi:hypothetical protein
MILDRITCPPRKEGHECTPFGAKLHNFLYQKVIFFSSPGNGRIRGAQTVHPSIATLARSSTRKPISHITPIRALLGEEEIEQESILQFGKNPSPSFASGRNDLFHTH